MPDEMTCPACGAPQPDVTADKCTNCGEDFTGEDAPPAEPLTQTTSARRVSFDTITAFAPKADTPAPAEPEVPDKVELPADPLSETMPTAPPAAPRREVKASEPGPEPPDPRRGQNLQGYVLEASLGADEHGEVYLAYHADLGTPAAIKLLTAASYAAARAGDRPFAERVQERAAIRHRNIIHLHTAGEDGGTGYIITEYVDGPRLEEYVEDVGALPPKRAAEWAVQLFDALAAAHEAEIRHCGLTPFTVIVDPAEHLKAALFGLGSFSGELAESLRRSLPYRSPEENLGRGPTPIRSDIYATGAVLFTMLTGKPPFDGETAEAVGEAQKAGALDPRDRVATLPGKIAAIVMQMMAPRAEDRFASAQEAAAPLREWLVSIQKGTIVGMEQPGGAARQGLEKLLLRMAEFGASDMLIRARSAPVYRVRGETYKVDCQPFTVEQVEAMVREILLPEQAAELQEHRSTDLALTVGDPKTQGPEQAGRFRLNVFYQRASLGLSVRRVSSGSPTLEDLLLPPALEKVTEFREGLVMVTGPTGAGKSTSLATILDCVNRTKRVHIITIEDPVEYVHEDKMAVITQREVGLDVPSFYAGIKDALRQDPDVILLGELRDADTVDTAVSASETGHLVMSTLHAKDVVEAIRRILSFFPTERHHGVRAMLAGNLRAMMSQFILPGRTKEHPRVVAVELLFNNDVVRQCIADAEDKRIPKQLCNYAHQGMQDFSASLFQLIQRGLVDQDLALAECPRPKDLQKLLGITGR